MPDSPPVGQVNLSKTITVTTGHQLALSGTGTALAAGAHTDVTHCASSPRHAKRPGIPITRSHLSWQRCRRQPTARSYGTAAAAYQKSAPAMPISRPQTWRLRPHLSLESAKVKPEQAIGSTRQRKTSRPFKSGHLHGLRQRPPQSLHHHNLPASSMQRRTSHRAYQKPALFTARRNQDDAEPQHTQIPPVGRWRPARPGLSKNVTSAPYKPVQSAPRLHETHRGYHEGSPEALNPASPRRFPRRRTRWISKTITSSAGRQAAQRVNRIHRRSG